MSLPNQRSNLGKQLAIIGATIGLLLGGGLAVVAFVVAPGIPGVWELMGWTVLVGALFVFPGAALGYIIGYLVSARTRRK